MKWPIVARVLVVVALPLAVGACQVTPEFVQALVCPAVPPPVVDPAPLAPEPSGW